MSEAQAVREGNVRVLSSAILLARSRRQESGRGMRWKKLKRRESFLSAVRHGIFVDAKDSFLL